MLMSLYLDYTDTQTKNQVLNGSVKVLSLVFFLHVFAWDVSHLHSGMNCFKQIVILRWS